MTYVEAFRAWGVDLDRTQGGCPAAHAAMRAPLRHRSEGGNAGVACMNSGVRPNG
ncbi:hypothetical protein STRIP9103_04238 [Streptomyces ipomoeae 91-03]|uniref:Uncharacterized protein n=1 Tax=Streptomyces ipomoeae 91-03 TaxID=698759 RepID=L1L8E8_9ACTN|nr:hypothetical protein STRIP9103_04238 [Streptomyces ipomoeae 91-03]